MSDEIGAIENQDTSLSFRWNTPFLAMLEEFRSIQICDDALAWCENQNNLYPGASFGDIMENFIADPAAEPGWAVMNLMIYAQQLDKKLVEGYVTKIINEGDPMSAYILLRDKYADLPVGDRNRLIAKFRDVLKNVDEIT